MSDGPPLALRVAGAGVTHHRGDESVVGLDDVSLVVEAGELVALVGPSGSGKTTLLTALAGWQPLDTGQLEVAGRPATAGVGWAVVALIPQGLGLLADLTLGENVRLPARLTRQAEAAARADGLERRLGIDHLTHRDVAEASLGEQQRASVARALLLRPALLLADEPTAHQDAQHAGEVVDLLRAAADAGGGVLVASHAAEVVGACDRVIALRDGRLDPAGYAGGA